MIAIFAIVTPENNEDVLYGLYEDYSGGKEVRIHFFCYLLSFPRKTDYKNTRPEGRKQKDRFVGSLVDWLIDSLTHCINGSAG
jgi:hypothetical protein